jgi:hypothetical protein
MIYEVDMKEKTNTKTNKDGAYNKDINKRTDKQHYKT